MILVSSSVSPSQQLFHRQFAWPSTQNSGEKRSGTLWSGGSLAGWGKAIHTTLWIFFLAAGSSVSLNLVNVQSQPKREGHWIIQPIFFVGGGGGGLKKIDQVEIIHSCLVFCWGENQLASLKQFENKRNGHLVDMFTVDLPPMTYHDLPCSAKIYYNTHDLRCMIYCKLGCF